MSKIILSRKAGFTLVEMAIVITIVGLLIGGVLGGQELLANARFTATISQVKSYNAALSIFRDRYKAYPGDMSSARTQLPNCSAATNCLNGDKNNRVGVANDANWYINLGASTENQQFWKHMALDNLITGIEILQPTVAAAATTKFGSQLPAAKVGGGFHAKTFTGCTNNVNFLACGLTFVLSSDPTGTVIGNPVSPNVAAKFDAKMDDGIATTGDVFAYSLNWNTGCGPNNTGINGSTGYNERDDNKVCGIGFSLAH